MARQFTTVTLNSDNNYRAQVHVPYGIEANGEVLTAGREVTFSEPTIDSRYELSYEPFTPMMVDGVPNYADDGSTTITATNTLKSQVEIAKVATSDDGTYPTDASFDFDVTVTTPDSSGVSYAIGDTKGTLTSGQTTTLSLAAGQSILLENLPVGTTYTVDEKSSPAGWIFSSVATGGAGTTSGDTVSGSVDQGNTKYSVTYTNKFTPVESSPTGDGGITINKTLNPTDLTAGQFSFTLTALDGAPAPASTTATNAADGSVSFGNITFSEVGTYEYTLAETNAGADGYTYDTHTYTLVATVTANADTNALEVAWSVKDSTSKDNHVQQHLRRYGYCDHQRNQDPQRA
jgi:pilin isopeptide linkage protein